MKTLTRPQWMPRAMGSMLNLDDTSRQTEQDAASAPPSSAAAAETRPGVAPWQQLNSYEAAAARRLPRALRVLVIAVLVLFLFLGVRAALAPKATVPAAQLPIQATFPQAAAGGAAVRFAPIYATWSQDAAEQRREGMATVWGGDPASGWNGKGWQTAAAPAVVGVNVQDAATARVTVVMTITSWTKDSKGKQTNLTHRPMALEIPVSVDPAGTARVSGVPVWVAVPTVLQPQTGTTNTDADSTATAATKAGAEAFFVAYGRDTDLNSLTAPGSTLIGLNGALTLDSLRSWTVHSVTGDNAQATAEVIWATPNGATVTQTYQVTLRRTTSGDASRWQVLTLTA